MSQRIIAIRVGTETLWVMQSTPLAAYENVLHYTVLLCGFPDVSFKKIQAPIHVNYSPSPHPYHDLILLFCIADSHKLALNDGFSWYHLIRRRGHDFEPRKHLLFCLLWFFLLLLLLGGGGGGVGSEFYSSIFICQGFQASKFLEYSRSIFHWLLFYFFLIFFLR